MIRSRGVITGFLLAVLAIVSACGGSSGGNSVSGTLTQNGAALRAATDGSTDSAAAGLIVELVDSEGNVVATDTVDSNGSFYFPSVDEGDYTIVVRDPDTGDEITSMSFSLVDGDNAIIEGSISGSSASWEVNYEANEGQQNETQNKKAVAIARAAGVPVSEVLAMRDSGMGWGAIAQALGVHPSELGMKNGFDKNKKSKVDKGKGCKNKDKGNGKGKKNCPEEEEEAA